MAPEHQVVTAGSALRAETGMPRPGVAGSPCRVEPFSLTKLPGLQADRWVLRAVPSCLPLAHRVSGQMAGESASTWGSVPACTAPTAPSPARPGIAHAASHHCPQSHGLPFLPRDETRKVLGSHANGNCQRGDCPSSHSGRRATHHEPCAPHVWAASS